MAAGGCTELDINIDFPEPDVSSYPATSIVLSAPTDLGVPPYPGTGAIPSAPVGPPPPYTPTPVTDDDHGYNTRAQMKKLMEEERKEREEADEMSQDDTEDDEESTDDVEEAEEAEEMAETEGDYRLFENGEMKIYGPKVRVTFSDPFKKIKKVEIGEPQPGATEKVIMIVGATGSGKTTLINGIYNYIVGVEWNDDYRLKLVEENPEANQAKSQTNWITAYTIHHKNSFNVQDTVTIIDTPGFGDTSGIKRDQEITEQIRTCFKTEGLEGIDHLDAVGFVAQSSLPRLTPTQRYVFDSILSLFGKDIEENIFMLLTFADSQKPQVLSGIKEANMPYKKFFKFNNSALYVSNQSNSDSDSKDDDDGDEMEFDEMFWKMGKKSFKTFISELEKTVSRSLILTQNVLDERQQLEVTVEGIQKNVKRGLNKLEQLRTEYRILDNHQADIEKNKDFTYTVNEQIIETERVPSGRYTTNCLKCNTTCHEKCIYNDDKDKYKCSAMSAGECTVCDLECHWSMHRNQPYIYVIRIQPKTKTLHALKKRYEEATGKKLSAEQLVKKSQEEFDHVQLRVLRYIDKARRSIARLDEIALRPNPLSTVNYIDILIKGEKTDCKPGWEERMDQLIEVKEKAKQMEALAEDNYDPLAVMKKKYDSERKGRQIDQHIKTTRSKFSLKLLSLQ